MARLPIKKRPLSKVSASTHEGGLHESLGIPESEKIGAARIEAATHSSNVKTRRQANLAQTYNRYRPRKGK